MRPIVGMTCYETRASWGPRTERAVVLSETYPNAVRRSGGVPVLLPPAEPHTAERMVSRLDALVLSGGGDADPARYGATAHPATEVEGQAREDWELALLAAAFTADLPVLGICRGAQMLSVARGGELVQHLPDDLGHDRHLPGTAQYGDHRLKIAPESLAGQALGEAVNVLCHHHQGFGSLGEGAHPVAWAEDGIVEGIELPGCRFAIGAQWHPERAGDDRLYTALVHAAAQ